MLPFVRVRVRVHIRIISRQAWTLVVFPFIRVCGLGFGMVPLNYMWLSNKTHYVLLNALWTNRSIALAPCTAHHFQEHLYLSIEEAIVGRPELGSKLGYVESPLRRGEGGLCRFHPTKWVALYLIYRFVTWETDMKPETLFTSYIGVWHVRLSHRRGWMDNVSSPIYRRRPMSYLGFSHKEINGKR